MWEYNHTDELYHYGIPGMQWGKRKANPTKVAYKQAKKEYRRASLKAIGPTLTGFGVKGIDRARQANKIKNQADMKRLDAKVAYKTSKIKNPNKAAKKEMNIYTKEMYKTGLPGSIADTGRSTRIYKQLKIKKGQAYADKVRKKVQNKSIAAVAGGTAALAGSLAVRAYFMNELNNR